MSKEQIKPGFSGVDPGQSQIFEQMPPFKHRKRKKIKEKDDTKKGK